MHKPIDMDAARIRIMKAYVDGMFRTYGPRRNVPVEREVTVPGSHYWDPNEEWTDPQGVKRKGRFKRTPSTKTKQTVYIPQGVVAEQMVHHAGAIVEAFLETLAIMEEAVMNKESPEHIASLSDYFLRKAR